MLDNGELLLLLLQFDRSIVRCPYDCNLCVYLKKLAHPSANWLPLPLV